MLHCARDTREFARLCLPYFFLLLLLLLPRFGGTFLPFLRASDSPMAMACLLLLTFLPLLPLLSVPRLRLRMLRSTSLEALREYRRAMVIPFLPGETTSVSQPAYGEAEWKNIKHPRIVPACEDNSHCACTLQRLSRRHARLWAGHPRLSCRDQDVDGRDKPGHDELCVDAT
jgi:hypothetical protein